MVEQRQETLAQEAKLVADLPVIRSVTQTNDTHTVEEAAKHYHDLASAGWIIVTDLDGKLIGSAGPDGGGITDWTSGALVKSAAEGSVVHGYMPVGDKVALAAAAPVFVGDYPVGTLTIAVPIDDALATKIAQSANTDIAFVLNGEVVGSSLGLDRSLGTELLGKSNFQWNRRPYAASPSALSETSGLQFVSLLDKSRVEGPFNSIQRLLGIVFAVSMAAALAIGYALASRLTKPLVALVRAAQELQAGSWPEPVTTSRQDEIGILQRVFDDTVVSLRESQESLLQMVQIDPLTRLPNHNTFRDRLASEVLAAQTADRPLSLLLIDIDNFEEFNLARGREEGDVVLVTVSDILRAWAGETAYVARFGGNEFAVIRPGASAPETTDSFAPVLEEIYARAGVTTSVGIAENGESTPRPDLLVLAANLAVQQAKMAGKNRCRTYDGDVTASSADDLKSFLQGGSYAAVRALAEAVDAKDRYTRGHSQRVAEYARDLARAAGYDEGFVELVYTTGTLHDVGKIGVPDSVLHKNGRLDDVEFEQIKVHPVLGEKIVAQIATLRETLPGIRHHHEQFDGRGYPDGLSGDDIPLIARILAVADTFDAMTSDRPYRKGLPLDVALGEISKNAGTQFDPELADLFVKIYGVRLAA